MTNTLKSSLAHWPEVSEAVFVPHTAAEYERLVALLDELVDELGNDESHPLASLWKSSDCSSRNTRMSMCPT
ncbi:MAG: HTH-type transcriptional regulator / antitoxin HigA [Chthoniobacter sp.]|jgi:HTH-type transcriptional regulator/antitoxin HigA|nr:HTH-type transcriptional regulator / antitoxin HigA [Chthoniobacter sp.]